MAGLYPLSFQWSGWSLRTHIPPRFTHDTDVTVTGTPLWEPLLGNILLADIFFLSCFKQYSFIKRWFLTYTTWKISRKVIFSGYFKIIKLETLAAQSPHAHMIIIWNWGAATPFWWDMSFPAILIYLSLISSVLNPKSFDTHISLLLISKYFKISFLIPNFKFNLLFNVWVIWECDFFQVNLSPISVYI